jgi:hypothetical protein
MRNRDEAQCKAVHLVHKLQSLSTLRLLAAHKLGPLSHGLGEFNRPTRALGMNLQQTTLSQHLTQLVLECK